MGFDVKYNSETISKKSCL